LSDLFGFQQIFKESFAEVPWNIAVDALLEVSDGLQEPERLILTSNTWRVLKEFFSKLLISRLTSVDIQCCQSLSEALAMAD
jgi:hypothetical protein